MGLVKYLFRFFKCTNAFLSNLQITFHIQPSGSDMDVNQAIAASRLARVGCPGVHCLESHFLNSQSVYIPNHMISNCLNQNGISTSPDHFYTVQKVLWV